MKQFRMIEVFEMAVCINSHSKLMEPIGPLPQVLHACGEWTFVDEDSDCCQYCGAKLEPSDRADPAQKPIQPLTEEEQEYLWLVPYGVSPMQKAISDYLVRRDWLERNQRWQQPSGPTGLGRCDEQ